MKGQDAGLARTIVIVATALIIGVYVYATISPLLANTTLTNVTVGYLNASTGATTLYLNPPIVPSSYTIYNSTATAAGVPTSAMNTLTEGTDYTLDGPTGALTNVTVSYYIRATYSHGQLSTAQSRTALTTVDTNTFNGFTLAAIVVIVIAAAAILRNLGMF